MVDCDHMTYDRAKKVLDGMVEAGIVSFSAKYDIMKIVIAYGGYRGREATNDAIKIFTHSK